MTIRYFLEVVDGVIIAVLSTDLFAPLPVYDDANAEAPEVVGWQRHPAISEGAPEVDEEAALAIRAGGRWSWDGTKALLEATSEPEAPPRLPISLSPAEFFGRMTDEEAKAIDSAMRASAIRIRPVWASVADQGRDLEEGTILWPALREEIVKLYGEVKAEQLLVSPERSEITP